MSKMNSTIRVAFGSVPKDGGTFTFYRNLRLGLEAHGIDLRCVSLGRHDAQLWDSTYADEGCTQLVPHAVGLKVQAQAFVEWCAQERIDIAIGINSAAVLSAFPHLPEHVRVMARCANAFDHGYRITMSGRERMTRIVALSPRLRDDLVQSYGADPEKIRLIPNGIMRDPFEAAAVRKRGQGGHLELAFLGRLEHRQKGVMHLPDIVAALDARGVSYRLRIAGKGKHGSALRAALATSVNAGSVEFLGAIGPSKIPEFLAESDVFVFTSSFEGMPNALLEAMMAGVVPVCFNIPGITDFMIEHDNTGMLCMQGDVEGFADLIGVLDMDRGKLAMMHKAVAAEARKRFTTEIAAKRYELLFREVMAEAPPPWTPRRWSDFEPDPNFPQTWRRFIPPALKDKLRLAADLLR